jgi:hypothetical protein
MFSPTLDYHEGPVGRLPIVALPEQLKDHVSKNTSEAIRLAVDDWNQSETSWEFVRLPDTVARLLNSM